VKSLSNLHHWNDTCTLSPEVLRDIFISNSEFLNAQTEFYAEQLQTINMNNPSFSSAPLEIITKVKHHINHGHSMSMLMFRLGEIF